MRARPEPDHFLAARRFEKGHLQYLVLRLPSERADECLDTISTAPAEVLRRAGTRAA